MSIFLWLVTSAWGYEPLQNLKFDSTKILRQYIEEQNVEVYYRYYYKESNYKSLIINGMEESTDLSLNEIKKSYPKAQDCKPYDIIEIYEVDLKVLNDENRFEIKKSIPQDIWGFYDPRANENYIDSIVLTSHGKMANYTVLVHEIAHYWYSRYCLENYTDMSSEQFATLIQNKIEWSNHE